MSQLWPMKIDYEISEILDVSRLRNLEHFKNVRFTQSNEKRFDSKYTRGPLIADIFLCRIYNISYIIYTSLERIEMKNLKKRCNDGNSKNERKYVLMEINRKKIVIFVKWKPTMDIPIIMKLKE